MKYSLKLQIADKVRKVASFDCLPLDVVEVVRSFADCYACVDCALIYEGKECINTIFF